MSSSCPPVLFKYTIGSFVSLTLSKATFSLSLFFETVNGDALIAIIISAPDSDNFCNRV